MTTHSGSDAPPELIVAAYRKVWSTIPHSHRLAAFANEIWKAARATPAAQAVPQTVEQATAELVQALCESKGWMRGYANAVVRDAIDRQAVAKPVPLTRSQIQTLVIEVCDQIYPQDNASYSEADSVFYGAFAHAIERAHGIGQEGGGA